MSYSYPILLDVAGRTIVIIGGGAVAARKARGLLAAGAGRVTVVAPEFHMNLPEGVQRIAATYDPSHLDGASLIFAATNQPAINDRVVADCRQRGIWVSRADADDDLKGDFVSPAYGRDGDVLVAVSTGGSPALSSAVRDELMRLLPDGWVQLAELTVKLRKAILQMDSLDAAGRSNVLRLLATDQARQVLLAGGEVALHKWLAQACGGYLWPEGE